MKKLLLLSLISLSLISPASDPFASLPEPQTCSVNSFPGYMKEKVHPCLPRVKAIISGMPIARLVSREKAIVFEDALKEADALFKAYDEIATPILSRSESPVEIINSISIDDLLALQAQIGSYLATSRGGGSSSAPRLGFRDKNMLVFYAEKDEILYKLAKKKPLTQIGIDISPVDQEHLYKLITGKYMELVPGGERILIEKLVQDYYRASSPLSPKDREVINKIASFPEDFSRVSELTENMLTSLKRDISNGMHPLRAAIIAHLKLAYIHPFCHGNGRTARTLFNIIIMAFGYAPLDFPEENDYQKTIQLSLSTKNPAYFGTYCINELKRITKLINSCASCGAEDVPSYCARCKIVKYCGRECQTAHWETHKLTCRPQAKPHGAGSGGAASSH